MWLVSLFGVAENNMDGKGSNFEINQNSFSQRLQVLKLFVNPYIYIMYVL